MRKLQRLRPLIWGFVVLCALVVSHRGLSINSLQCQTNNGECTTRERDIVNSYKGRFALTLNRNRIESEIKKDPRVESVKIKLSLGVKLTVSVTYKDNSLALKILPPVNEDKNATGSSTLWNKVNKMLAATSTESSYFKLWEDGYLTSAPQDSEFDAIMYADKMPNSDVLRDIFVQLTYVRENFTDKPVYIQENAILMKIDDRTILLFDVKKDPQMVFETLQQIQAVTTIEKGIRLIDLRFNKPVISFYKNE